MVLLSIDMDIFSNHLPFFIVLGLIYREEMKKAFYFNFKDVILGQNILISNKFINRINIFLFDLRGKN